MGRELDIDDVAYGHPLAESDLAELRSENEDIKLLNQKLNTTQKQLSDTKLVLGTLITWLQNEIGREGATKLIDDLNT